MEARSPVPETKMQTSSLSTMPCTIDRAAATYSFLVLYWFEGWLWCGKCRSKSTGRSELLHGGEKLVAGD